MIVFTDIHGNFDTFMALYNKIPQSKRDMGIVIAGDLIDRGPKSKQMVQWCIDHPEVGVVTGNHEMIMVDVGMKNAEYFINNGDFYPGDHIDYSASDSIYSGGGRRVNMWGVNGGFETMNSYITDHGDDTATFDLKSFKSHLEWMKNLPLYLEFKDVKNEKGEHLLVTHSSASKVWKWDDQRRKNMREHFVDHLVWGRPNNIQPIPGVFNIFGHTPMPDGARIREGYANIDTGCFHSGKRFGKLTAISFPDMSLYEQENLDGFYKPF